MQIAAVGMDWPIHGDKKSATKHFLDAARDRKEEKTVDAMTGTCEFWTATTDKCRLRSLSTGIIRNFFVADCRIAALNK